MENESSANVCGYQDAMMETSSHISGRENDTHQQEMEEEESESFPSTLPRPPKEPNVPIEDETICPICTEIGMSTQTHIYVQVYSGSMNRLNLNILYTKNFTWAIY